MFVNYYHVNWPSLSLKLKGYIWLKIIYNAQGEKVNQNIKTKVNIPTDKHLA